MVAPQQQQFFSAIRTAKTWKRKVSQSLSAASGLCAL